jgi:hypothetical protein
MWISWPLLDGISYGVCLMAASLPGAAAWLLEQNHGRLPRPS